MKVRALFLITGLIAIICGALARNLGLGEATNFVLFKLFHLTRSGTIQIGFFFILICLLPRRETFENIRLSLPASVRTALTRTGPSEQPGVDWPSFIPTLIQQLAIAVIVAISAFWVNQKNLLGYIDGQYLLTLVRNQDEFASRYFGFSANPLQGLGDLWYFSNTRWIPELFVANLTSDPVWQRVAIHCVAFVEIFIAISVFARWLGLPTGRAIASGWLAVIIVTPLTYPALIYNISPDAPQIASLTAWPLLLIPLVCGIGRGTLLLDLVRCVAVALLLWLHFVAFGPFTALIYPFLALTWTIFVAASWPHKNEFWRKVTWSVFLFIFLVISGLPQIFLGNLQSSAFYAFPELSPINHDLDLGTALLRINEPVAFGFCWLGLIGASYCAVFSRGRIRWLGLSVVIFAGILIIATVSYMILGSSGAKPIYYEYMLWVIYPIFGASVLGAIWDDVWPHLLKALGRIGPPIASLLWLVLPLAGLTILLGPNAVHRSYNDRPNIYPPKPTILTDYLGGEVGIAPGASFKGRVVNLTGQAMPPNATWDQAFTRDLDLIRSLGNDHRNIGLWYYNIPTLFEFSHTLPSDLFLVVRRYLAEKGDTQVRNLMNMRRANIQILRLLGVRYIITDRVTPTEGTSRVRQLAAPGGPGLLAIDEISNPNLGVSPTDVIVGSQPSEQALRWIDVNNFEHRALLAEPVPSSLVAATDIAINVEHDGIRIRALSSGQSLVVIPFQFSHCLQATSHIGPQAPEIRRADFMLTGLLFSGRLDTTIRYRQGPFQGTWCRLEDAKDDRNLAIRR